MRRQLQRGKRRGRVRRRAQAISPSREHTIIQRYYPRHEPQSLATLLCRVDYSKRKVRQVHLRVQRLTRAFYPEVCTGGVIVGAVDLPGIARPRRVRHPQQTTAVLGPEVRLEALEDRAIGDQVHHLRLALEVLETRGSTELMGERAHEARDIAVSSEVPVVISKGIADRPSVGLRQRGLQRLQRGKGCCPYLNGEAVRKLGEILHRRSIVVGTAALKVDAVGAAGVVTRAIERCDQIP